MDHWDIEPGPVADPLPQFSGVVTLYLWGFLIVLAAALALGGWVRGNSRRNWDELWGYFVAALLWPLFVCAVLFVILWGLLSRPGDHR